MADPADRASSPWLVLSVTGLGMFLSTVNSGTLLIALPDLERTIGASLLSLVWVILAYMVSSTVLLLTAGRLADQFGRRAFLLDLSLFRIRVYTAAAAFLNGLAPVRPDLLFVFYFHGPQGDDPITAGIKLIPLAAGMVVASPPAGMWADRHGSHGTAVAGMLVTAVGLVGMTTLRVDARLGVCRMAWDRGRGLGHVQLAQHRGHDVGGADPPARHRLGHAHHAAEHRRGHLHRPDADDHHHGGAR